ncbi:carbohydrate kinase family protein [Jiangella muralis]|uniref:carbohydrate kinase family protein n=1 Tax=Jiangella muralis TaxID=702383 RepID=UPI00069DF456|nr:sugar kinase [Jiangella muralis]
MSSESAGRSDGRDPAVVCAGLIVADTFVPPLQRLPGPGELVATDDFLLGAGGCAANTAATLARLNVPVALAAKVGADQLGDWLRADLAARGVGVAQVSASRRLPTSQTVILPVIGEDRRYIHTAGANAELTVADIGAAVPGARALAVGGFLALPGVRSQELAELFATVRDAGVRTILDVVVPSGGENLGRELRLVLPHVDCFLPNQDEAAALTGEDSLAKQAEVLLGWGCASLIITCGSTGALFADADGSFHVRPPVVEAVDTSGSGDAFTAGLIAGMLEGWGTEQQVRFATAVGASACRGLGCHTTIATRDEALAALRRTELVAAHTAGATATDA